MTPPHRRLAGDEGVVFAEFALVLPFILWAVLGIFEFGTAWRNTTIVSAALRSAVRVEAQAQKTPGADMYAVQSFKSAMSQTKNMTINKILVYDATDGAASSAGTSGKPSANCIAATNSTTDAGECNVYSGAKLNTSNLVLSSFGTAAAANCTGKYDENYCPITGRKVKLTDGTTGPTLGPDLIGVYADITYKSMTKILPTTVKVKDYSTARIEPQA